MKTVTLEELLEAGCHFGHQVNRRNPKANDFIFEARNNVHIIDLGKTLEGLTEAAEYVKKLSSKNGYFIVIGTKRQAKNIVKTEVERAIAAGAKGIFFIDQRWIGGVLTNFSEVSKNFKRLSELNSILSTSFSGYTKRELLLFERERQKLLSLYQGIANLDRIPDAVFIVDTHLERTAVREAQSVGITTVGIVDSNANPYEMNYPIPANDDAVGSIQLIVSYIVDAWIEGGKNEVKNEKGKVQSKEKEETKSVESESKSKVKDQNSKLQGKS